MQRQKKYAEAITILDELVKSYKSVDMVQPFVYRKGVISDKYLKDYDQAAEFYSQAIDLDPESAVAWNARRRLAKMDREHKPAGKEERPEKELKFSAHNYPNPANPGTGIQYVLPEDGFISINIYNITGQVVATLLQANMPAGRHTVRWDGRSSFGTDAATGMYFYRLEFEDQVLSNKFLLLR